MGIDSDDAPLQERFGVLFGECQVSKPDPDSPRVVCSVRCRTDPLVASVHYRDPEPLDTVAFATALFPDRGVRELPAPAPGWRLLGGAEGFAPVAVQDPWLLVDRAAAWQSLAGNLAVNRIIRLQRDQLFFHAASVAVAGRGALLIGPKGAGKTTLALGLGARGHAVFGEEIAAVRIGDLTLVPFRRSVSVREGPASAAAALALEAAGGETELFPDGTVRRRAEVGRLFPGSTPGPAPLRTIFFLAGIGKAPRASLSTAGRENLRQLTPLGSTLWGVPAPVRAMRLLSLLGAIRCFLLELGPPEATLDLIETTLEGC